MRRSLKYLFAAVLLGILLGAGGKTASADNNRPCITCHLSDRQHGVYSLGQLIARPPGSCPGLGQIRMDLAVCESHLVRFSLALSQMEDSKDKVTLERHLDRLQARFEALLGQSGHFFISSGKIEKDLADIRLGLERFLSVDIKRFELVNTRKELLFYLCLTAALILAAGILGWWVRLWPLGPGRDPLVLLKAGRLYFRRNRKSK